jgi:MFS superfamily sulfate permease-like transporter
MIMFCNKYLRHRITPGYTIAIIFMYIALWTVCRMCEQTIRWINIFNEILSILEWSDAFSSDEMTCDDSIGMANEPGIKFDLTHRTITVL